MKDLNDHCTECGAYVPLVNGRQPYHPYLYCELKKLGHRDPEHYLHEHGFHRDGVVDAMRRAGWSENEIGAAMDAREAIPVQNEGKIH